MRDQQFLAALAFANQIYTTQLTYALKDWKCLKTKEDWIELRCFQLGLFFLTTNCFSLSNVLKTQFTEAMSHNRGRRVLDPRAARSWDNFSIFRTNCAIRTSYIRVDPPKCRLFSRGCFDVP